MASKIPVFIIMRDLLTWPQAMVPHIERMGGEPIMVDNASTYPPLLDWYATGPCEIVRLPENMLQHSPWLGGAVDHYVPDNDGRYAVTDPDLDISGCPDCTLEHLNNLYERYFDIVKCGLSLEILDLPEDSPVYREAKGWETPFWLHKRDWQCYRSPVDTTFAIYNKKRPPQFQYNDYFTQKAVRADRPFTARHLPFYWTPENFDLESWYYLKHANPRSTMARYLAPLVAQWEQAHHREVERYVTKRS